MRRLAAELDVTATALYRHVRNKNELITLLVAEANVSLARFLVRANKATTPRAALDAIIEGYFRFALGRPREYELLFLLRNRPRLTTLGSEPQSDNYRRLRTAVADCMAAGALRPDDVDETAFTIWALMHGVVGLYRQGRLGRSPTAGRAYFNRAVRRLLAGLEPEVQQRRL